MTEKTSAYKKTKPTEKEKTCNYRKGGTTLQHKRKPIQKNQTALILDE